MISNYFLKSRKGNITVSTVLGVFGALTAYSILRSGLETAKNATTTSADTKIMMDAHSLANLLKYNLSKVYTAKYTAKSGAWSDCNTKQTANEFLSAFEGSMTNGSCQSATFDLPDFTISGSQSPVQNMQVSAFKNQKFETKENLNGYKQVIQNISFDLDPNRNRLVADLEFSGIQMKFTKVVRIVIDMQRTVAAPSGRKEARLCRNVAGSVCDSFEIPPQLPFYFLDSTGNILTASYQWTDPSDHSKGGTQVIGAPTPAPAANPIAESAKNITSGHIDYYRQDSFCVSKIQGTTPVLYVIDAAQDDKGEPYYLTTHGMLLDKDGTNVWSPNDPKMVSLGYDNAYWYLLRSDGVVLQGTNIKDPSTFSASGLVLETAKAIATGLAPAPCN